MDDGGFSMFWNLFSEASRSCGNSWLRLKVRLSPLTFSVISSFDFMKDGRLIYKCINKYVIIWPLLSITFQTQAEHKIWGTIRRHSF